jgi:hypothetical protein
VPTAELRVAVLVLACLPACFGEEPDQDGELQRTASGPITSACVSPVPEDPAEQRTDLAGSVSQPTFGTDCGAVGDDGCVLTLKNGALDRSMFCHPTLQMCVLQCTSRPNCPITWTCDTRSETVEQSRKPFCVNSNCSSK